MAAIDTTRQTAIGAWADDCELPQLLIDELFDPRCGRAGRAEGNFPAGWEWVRAMMRGSEAEATPTEEIILGTDELTREGVSSARAPVVITVTDEQAEQLVRFRRRGALTQ